VEAMTTVQNFVLLLVENVVWKNISEIIILIKKINNNKKIKIKNKWKKIGKKMKKKKNEKKFVLKRSVWVRFYS
jgi:hypothetical protein